MKIGILALQGAFREHKDIIEDCGVACIEVRKSKDLAGVNGLIIPGGESTTIGKLMVKYGLDKEIKKRCKEGMHIYGTCAGSVVLAKDIIGIKQFKLGLMDIAIKRNAYGRQIDSFEANLNIKNLGWPFKGVFIRAPIITSVHNGVKILAKFENKPVMAKQKNLLVSTFHPELTGDKRIHQYFINMIRKSKKS